MTEACVFCDIIADHSPRSVVYEDAYVLAFLDIRPVTPGHTLIVAKPHAPLLSDLPQEIGGHMFKVAMRIAAALRRAERVRAEGVNLFYADGAVAFQEVFHAHLHVIPRFRGDGFMVTAHSRETPARPELDAVAKAVAEAIS